MKYLQKPTAGKKKRPFILLVVTLFGCGCMMIFAFYSDVESRTIYIPINLKKVAYFQNEYMLAKEQGAGWLKDPQQVAMHFAGGDSSVVSSFHVGTGKTIVIITNRILDDDSVAGVKVRVDLMQEDGVWKIEWAGRLVKCRRGRTDLGMYLLDYNPLWHIGWAEPINDGLRAIIYWLNPWRAVSCS